MRLSVLALLACTLTAYAASVPQGVALISEPELLSKRSTTFPERLQKRKESATATATAAATATASSPTGTPKDSKDADEPEMVKEVHQQVADDITAAIMRGANRLKSKAKWADRKRRLYKWGSDKEQAVADKIAGKAKKNRNKADKKKKERDQLNQAGKDLVKGYLN